MKLKLKKEQSPISIASTTRDGCLVCASGTDPIVTTADFAPALRG
jgi:hypothetical protein